ncbi:MAG: TlpA family protein disulfide reductase [Flavobacteriales bacterium]
MCCRFLLLFLLLAGHTQSQVLLRGLSFWNEPELQIYQIDNHLSKEKKWLQSVRPDSLGIFNAQLQLKANSTLQICSSNKCAVLYTQPKGRYIIELPLIEQSSNYNEQMQEVELLFYKLDTNDINYRILGFEAWMDNYIADIYQLKDIRSEEFIYKVLAFKAETARVYSKDTNTFLGDYIKYSVGLTIDNFSVIGGPSKDDKFNFYLQTDSVNFQQPKLIEYAQVFYEHYDAQLEQNQRLALEAAMSLATIENMVNVLQNDAHINNRAWAEFVALQLILEYEQSKRLEKTLAIELLTKLSQTALQQGLQQAAKYFLNQKLKLAEGQIWNTELARQELKLKIENGKYLYLHHYIPGNQKCIAEMAALKRLAKRYEKNLQIITFYPSEQAWTTADQKAFEGVSWQRKALSKEHALWQQLSWSAAPAYILLDPNLKVLDLNALGPLPNARTQTIDLILAPLFNN